MKKFEIEIGCGDYFVSPKELPYEEPLRNVMSLILDSQSGNCGNKKAFLKLVKYNAKEIIRDSQELRKKDLKELKKNLIGMRKYKYDKNVFIQHLDNTIKFLDKIT